MISWLLCLIGWHGPNIYGNDPHGNARSGWDGGFRRKCCHCGAVWHGCEVETGRGINAYRTVGGWRRIPRSRAKAPA